MAVGFDMSGSFDTESDACLMSLKELFLTRVNQNKERRIKQNQANVMMSGLSRVTWLTLIMPFLQLDESLCLGKTCLYFNQLTRSPIFVKLQVSMNERTKIDVSLDTFGASRQALPSHAGVNLFQSSLAQARGLSLDMENEKQQVLLRG